jgi:uncharacterized membrane protein YphA (DoxX/SURF4 family)
VLRIVLGIICIRIGLRALKDTNAPFLERCMGALSLVGGSLLFLGLYTQAAALVTLFVSSLGFLRIVPTPLQNRTTLILMATISLSLFVTGAGPFAFDLPI